jgi:lipoprotein-anchoring transpeptidase ErfK/SrfK
VAAAGLAVIALLGLSACTSPATAGHPTAGQSASAAPSPTPTTAPVRWVTTPVDKAEKVPVDTRVAVQAEDGTLTSVVLSYTSKKGQRIEVDGWLESGTWTAKDLLEPGVKYTVRMKAQDESGKAVSRSQTFRTANLTLDDQIWVNVIPGDGQTVGVGMPVIVTFDLPVVDRATFEKHMSVTSTPAQAGSWYWLSDREAHWRPKNYWQPGTKVHVEANLNGVPAGGGRWGEQSRSADFTVGRSVIAKADLKTHQMDVYIDGTKVKRIPISGGRPGWETRSGVKVVMAKYSQFTMKAESIGLKPGDKDFYHDVTVNYALPQTHSGQFLHTAPWSVSQQGHANVSHGCTGISDQAGDWVWQNFRIGDVVETTGSNKPMTMGNGYADWNLGWKQYQQGSAL